MATCSGPTAREDQGQIEMDSSKKAPHAELSRKNSGPLKRRGPGRTKDSLQEVHSLIYTNIESGLNERLPSVQQGYMLNTCKSNGVVSWKKVGFDSQHLNKESELGP